MPSATEVMASNLEEQGARYPKASAKVILSALRKAGYAVVELVDVDELRSGWCLDVKADGQIVDHGPMDAYSAEDARGFAAALLAAANAAEATK